MHFWNVVGFRHVTLHHIWICSKFISLVGSSSSSSLRLFSPESTSSPTGYADLEWQIWNERFWYLISPPSVILACFFALEGNKVQRYFFSLLIDCVPCMTTVEVFRIFYFWNWISFDRFRFAPQWKNSWLKTFDIVTSTTSDVCDLMFLKVKSKSKNVKRLHWSGVEFFRLKSACGIAWRFHLFDSFVFDW